MIINLADNFLASLDDDVSCPSATINSSINYANRQNAIEISNYGPLNTAVQNPDYWELVSSNLNVPVNILRKRLCNNCFYFNASIELEACIVNGDNAIDEYATRESGDVGFCELWDFKASEYRRCNVWSLKNIAQETNDLEQYKMAVNQPRVPKGSSSGGQFGSNRGGAGGGDGAVMTDTVDREGVNGSVWSIITVRVNDKKVGEMEMQFNPQTQSYQVREIKVDEAQRGKDLGKELYKAGMIHAVSKGVGFTSDVAVSRSADNVWSSLKKEGWPVRKHEGAVLRQGEEKWHVERLQIVGNASLSIRVNENVWSMVKGVSLPTTPAESKMAANQPRVPKGSSAGGQFGSNRGGAGGGITGASRTFAAGQDEKINDTLKQEQGAYIDTLSKDQMRSVSDYQQIETYEEVNGALRNSTSLSPENQTLVTNLDSAIAGSGMEIKTTVYRGLVDDNGSLERLKVGDTMLEKGYSSTSPNPAVAEAFANSAYSPEGKPYVLQIEVPAKHPAIAADVVSNKLSGTDLIQTDPMTVELTGYTRLNEVTLPRNLSMAVKEITVKENATYITVSITK